MKKSKQAKFPTFDDPPLVSIPEKPMVFSQKTAGFACQIKPAEKDLPPFGWLVVRTDGKKDVRTGKSKSFENAVKACNRAIATSMRTPLHI